MAPIIERTVIAGIDLAELALVDAARDQPFEQGQAAADHFLQVEAGRSRGRRGTRRSPAWRSRPWACPRCGSAMNSRMRGSRSARPGRDGRPASSLPSSRLAVMAWRMTPWKSDGLVVEVEIDRRLAESPARSGDVVQPRAGEARSRQTGPGRRSRISCGRSVGARRCLTGLHETNLPVS